MLAVRRDSSSTPLASGKIPGDLFPKKKVTKGNIRHTKTTNKRKT